MTNASRDFTFKEFVVNSEEFSDADIYSMYIDPYSPKKVREISEFTGKSIGEIYRIINRYGGPNRLGNRHHLVFNYFDGGMKVKNIAELTGYTERGIREILRKRNANQSE